MEFKLHAQLLLFSCWNLTVKTKQASTQKAKGVAYENLNLFGESTVLSL
jgi:hypothetical protein